MATKVKQSNSMNKIGIGAVFLIIGIGLIYYSFSAPCTVGSIKSIAESQSIQGRNASKPGY